MVIPASASPLPSYVAPPVQRVSFALLLDPLPLKLVHLGLLWTEVLRDEYPDFDDLPPFMNQLEQFAGETALPQFQFQIMQGPPAPQVVFKSAAGNTAFGVQADRLTYTWEATSSANPYPRYPALRAALRRDADGFATFCNEHEIGPVALRQIEVQYVNVLTSGEGWDRLGELHRVLRLWSPDTSDDLGEPEDVRIAQRYVAMRDDGEPYARLHVAIEPSRSADGATTMQMVLTFRGIPEAFELNGIFDFIDDAHERIVRAFTAATTAEMHEVWGRES